MTGSSPAAAFSPTRTGSSSYLAEGGDLICVSNFPGAMLDLPIESSQATSDLLFEAFTEHIPPVGTKVRLVLAPRLEKGESKSAKSDTGGNGSRQAARLAHRAAA